MTIFKTFDESLFREFRSTTKEGLNDLGANQEEIDKIEFEISQSRHSINLNVDYTDFANHIFFGSALAAVNFALSRLLNDYPIDGELKEKNEWKRVNSGYENYFFNQYPKQQGYYFGITGSSQETWIEVDDHEYKFRPGTGSVCFDLVVKTDNDLEGSNIPQGLISLYEPADTDGFAAYFTSSTLVFAMNSGGVAFEILTASYSEYVSSSHALSFVYSQPSQKQIIYIDGQLMASRSLSTPYGNVEIPSKKLYIGALSSSALGGFGFQFSGGIDDVRVWIGPSRKEELIKRNYYRPVHADVSGGLKAYYKFNETSVVNNAAIDYSSNQLHGTITGSFSFATNIISGTLGSFFKDSGDPIFDLANSRVVTFVDNLRTSGSYYDRENRNFIYNLIPSFFIDEGDEHDDMQRFLLLVARHYDRLKLYIEHLSNVYNVEEGEYNNTPDELLGLVARHFGLDLGNVYEGANALEYFFGEDVIPSGSLDNSIEKIRNELRRNLLGNLIYIIKTKSTRQALESSLRSLGLDEEIVNINEYSVFSGGIKTGRTDRTVERRVARFLTSSNVFLTSSTFSDVETRAYQVRTFFNSASVDLTASVFTFASGADGTPFFYLEVERENLTSSKGVAKLYHSGASFSPLSSSLFSMFDNEWINFYADRNPTAGDWSLFVTKLYCGEILSSSMTASGDSLPTPGVDAISTASLGSKNSEPFDGFMQEFRAWSDTISSDLIVNHTKDFESLAVGDITTDIQELIVHLKLNDFTGSSDGTAPVHSYVDGELGSTYSGLSSSAVYNFPGKYIQKLEPSYSYDFGINNDKIRIRDLENFTKNDVIKDIPYLSVDMSPIISLNREIIRWFGDLEKFNNLIGKPYLRYRQEVDTLNDIKYHFFNERINSKIDFKAYLQLLKWFDSNFTFFLSQLIPLDLGTSLSNFVVESHLLEHNQVPRVFPFKKHKSSSEITGSISTRPLIDVALTGEDLPLADPGRFGAAVSASADIVTTENFALFFSSSISGSTGVNFRRSDDRELLTDILQENSRSNAPEGYGNGWYITEITGANYLKNVLNVNSDFHISGVHFSGASDTSDTLYLSSNYGRPLNTHYTGAINGVQDSTWLWYKSYDLLPSNSKTQVAPSWVYGIGYGGAWGQLPTFNNRGRRAGTLDLNINESQLSKTFEVGLGGDINESFAQQKTITVKEETDTTKTYVLWPDTESFEPIFIQATGSNGTFDATGSIIPINPIWTGGGSNIVAEHADFWSRDIIEIKGFKNLNITIAAKRISAPTGNDTPIKFTFRFQFFDKDLPGPDDAESALSSSFVLTGSEAISGKVVPKYVSERVEHEYVIEKIAKSTTSQHSFRANFERELPKAKYMRTYVRIEYPLSADNQSNTGYKVLIKGTLNESTDTYQSSLLNERGGRIASGSGGLYGEK